jgi:hypothetical protein
MQHQGTGFDCTAQHRQTGTSSGTETGTGVRQVTSGKGHARHECWTPAYVLCACEMENVDTSHGHGRDKEESVGQRTLGARRRADSAKERCVSSGTDQREERHTRK